MGVVRRLHQRPQQHLTQTGPGPIPSLLQILKHVKMEAGTGISRIVLVIATRQMRHAAVPAVRPTSYLWMVMVVVVLMTIVRFPMVVLQGQSTVEEAAAVFQRQF